MIGEHAILGMDEYIRFVGSWMDGRKESNCLFNDALNTFYLWLKGVRHIVKNPSVRGNLLPPQRELFFLLAARVLLYSIIQQTG